MDEIRKLRGVSRYIRLYEIGVLTKTEFWQGIISSIFHAERNLPELDCLPPEYQALFRAIFRDTLLRDRTMSNLPFWMMEYLTRFGIFDWCNSAW